MPPVHEPTVVYRDNLFFDELISALLWTGPRNSVVRCCGFLSGRSRLQGTCAPAFLFLYPGWQRVSGRPVVLPNGPVADVEPLVIDMQAREVGYYHVPTYMADQSGESAFPCSTAFPDRNRFLGAYLHRRRGLRLFGRGARFEKRLMRFGISNWGVLSKAVYEGRQLLECSELVKMGRNCVIDPRAVSTDRPPSAIMSRSMRRGDRELHHRQQRQCFAGCPIDAFGVGTGLSCRSVRPCS